MIDQTRRKLVKGLAYGLALSSSAVSATSFALDDTSTGKKTVTPHASSLPTCDITIFQQQSSGKETVSLMNLTGKSVTLDEITPVGLEHINGSLVVRLNPMETGSVVLKPGARLSFDIEAFSRSTAQSNPIVPNVLAGHVRIKSNHPAFNGKIPVTVFDNQAA